MLKINQKSLTIFWLTVIFFTALFFRTTNLDHFFASSDTVWQAHIATKFFPSNGNNFFNLIIEVHGLAAPLTGALVLLLAKFFSFPLTELAWNLPFILIGSATIFPVYFLTRKLAGPTPGLIAALLIAIYPWHVFLSRFSGFGHSTVSLFLEISALLTLINYFSNPSKKNCWLFSIFATLDILLGLFFPFFILLIPLVAILLNYQNSFHKTFVHLWPLIFRWPVIVLPTLAAFIQLAIIPTGRGVLNRGGASHDSWWGFHFSNFFSNGVYFSSLIIFPILIGLTLASFAFLKPRNKSSALVLWIYIFALPYLFFFPRYPTRYFIHLLIPMLILTVVWLSKFWQNKKLIFPSRLAVVIVLVIMGGTFMLFSIGGVYHLNSILAWQKDIAQIHNCQRDCLEIANANNGIKAAAYWIQQNTKTTDVIFAYNLGGIGLEPTVLDYYIRRPYVALHDAQLEEMNFLLRKAYNQMDYLLVENKYHYLVKDCLRGDFYPRLVVLDQAQPILYLYSREQIKEVEEIDLAMYSKKFEQNYLTYPAIIDYRHSYSYFDKK